MARSNHGGNHMNDSERDKRRQEFRERQAKGNDTLLDEAMERMRVRDESEEFYTVRELSELNGTVEGIFLTDALECLLLEVEGMMARDTLAGQRQLAMVKTKLEEARFWAIDYGTSKGTHFIIDRRRLSANG